MKLVIPPHHGSRPAVNKPLWVLVLALIMLSLTAGTQLQALQASARNKTAAINGTVTGPTGDVISGAEVSLSGEAGFKQQAKTNDKGEYAFRNLVGGTYTLTITAPGFAVQTFDYVRLTAGNPLTLDAFLEPTAVKSGTGVVASSAQPQATAQQPATAGEQQATELQPPATAGQQPGQGQVPTAQQQTPAGQQVTAGQQPGQPQAPTTQPQATAGQQATAVQQQATAGQQQATATSETAI